MIIKLGYTSSTLVSYPDFAGSEKTEIFDPKDNVRVIDDIESMRHFFVKPRKKSTFNLKLIEIDKTDKDTLLDNYLDQTIPIWCQLVALDGVTILDGWVYISSRTTLTTINRYTIDIIIYAL
jgi:hypothetical protein